MIPLYTKYNIHTNNLMIRLIFQLLLFESTQISFYNEIVVFCLRTNCNNQIPALAIYIVINTYEFCQFFGFSTVIAVYLTNLAF